MHFCAKCLLRDGGCAGLVKVVPARKLDNPYFIYDLRVFVHGIARDKRLSRDRLLQWLMDIDANYQGCFVDEHGRRAELDPSGELNNGSTTVYWLRDTFLKLPTLNGARYVRREAKLRFRLAATLVSIVSPIEFRLLGQRPANDTTWPGQRPAANDNEVSHAPAAANDNHPISAVKDEQR